MSKLLGGCLVILLAMPTLARADGEDEVKELLKALKAGDARTTAALVKLGARAAPALVEYTHANSGKERGPLWAAADVLGRIGAPAVPAVRDGLKKRRSAYLLSALKNMG